MIREGTEVKWKWGKGTASGKVVESYTHRVTKNIDGKNFVRNGSQSDKALLIQQEDGQEVLKLESEVDRD